MRNNVVYILASRSHCLYVGVTSCLARRLHEHRTNQVHHTAKYRIHRLVHVETFDDIMSAIAREKRLEGWTRARKVALITASNPAWDELAPY